MLLLGRWGLVKLLLLLLIELLLSPLLQISGSDEYGEEKYDTEGVELQLHPAGQDWQDCPAGRAVGRVAELIEAAELIELLIELMSELLAEMLT